MGVLYPAQWDAGESPENQHLLAGISVPYLHTHSSLDLLQAHLCACRDVRDIAPLQKPGSASASAQPDAGLPSLVSRRWLWTRIAGLSQSLLTTPGKPFTAVMRCGYTNPLAINNSKTARFRARAKTSPGCCCWGRRRHVPAALGTQRFSACTQRVCAHNKTHVGSSQQASDLRATSRQCHVPRAGDFVSRTEVVGRAGEGPCKLKAWSSIACRFPGCSHSILEGLHEAQGETAFKTRWPQPNKPKKAATGSVNSQGTRTWQGGQSHAKGGAAELGIPLHPFSWAPGSDPGSVSGTVLGNSHPGYQRWHVLVLKKGFPRHVPLLQSGFHPPSVPVTGWSSSQFPRTSVFRTV